MKTQQSTRHLPFRIEQANDKKKKKSVVSQKMKQKKSKIKQQQRKDLKNNHSLDQQQSDDEYITCKRPKPLQPLQMYDKINYITLQQFQGTIQDQRTLEAYQYAITSNSHLFANKIVLHLTTMCNCYYSIFAASAGASKVYCVVNGHNLAEQQNIWMMKEIIKENKLEKIIEVMSFKDFNAEVDIIIGQPMGFCMHYGGMLDRMVQARDLYLDKKNGIIFPNKLSFKCALINDEHFYDKKIQFWDSIYGIPMKSMQKCISSEPIIKVVDPSLIVSQIHKFIEFDLNTLNYSEVEEMSRQFSIKILEDTQTNGLSIWFEIQFNCEGQKSQLKASPWQNPTKFTHVTLYTSKKLKFQAETKVPIKMYGKKYSHQGINVLKVNIADQIESVYTFS